MTTLLRDFFIALSNNKLLKIGAKKWGVNLGADQFIAGTNVESAISSVKELNKNGLSCTIDKLGEFITVKSEAIAAKDQILAVLESIHIERVDCHISVKLTQLGLDISKSFCLSNMNEILAKAKKYDIFVNIDTEDYAHYEQTLEIMHVLKRSYDNVGTVLQSYLYRASEDISQLKDTRLRIVKGAYKERPEVAYQSREEVDQNFLMLVKRRLLTNTFTSIATHDHHLIEKIKKFVKENDINKRNFEFQMLYGFRTELQNQLVEEGYLFCTYIPFGHDWYGYFMRRLAERPQNINLLLKDKLYSKSNTLKKAPVIIVATILVTSMLVLRKRQK